MIKNEEAYGSYGEFDHAHITANWTDEEWSAHDAFLAAELAEWDAKAAAESEWMDIEPPF